jgi:hypothetical protein
MSFLDHALKIDTGHSRAIEMREELRLALGMLPTPTNVRVEVDSEIVVPDRMQAKEFIALARFLGSLETSGGAVKVSAGEQFRPLLAHLHTPLDLLPKSNAPGGLPLPALLSLIGLDAERAEATIPYIRAADHTRRRWHRALEEHPRPWIGLVWDGNPMSVSMATLRATLPVGGSAISLTVGAARHDLKGWPEAVDAGRHLLEFDDLVAAIDCLDAVIGPDVPTLHLAGALGRPGVVLVPTGLPWYWAMTSDRSIWYPSIKVVRQERVGVWEPVVAAARTRVAGLITSA